MAIGVELLGGQINISGGTVGGSPTGGIDGEFIPVPTATTNGVSSGISAQHKYYMRATDTTLSKLVYWAAYTIDSTGASYTGPGPLTNIVTMNVPPLNYRMRARDTTLAKLVYWMAYAPDPTGALYTGPGPLTGIVVTKILSQS